METPLPPTSAPLPAADALAQHLSALAAAGETIPYGALARDLDLRMGALTFLLEAMMAEDHAAGRPLRAVLCRARLGSGLPAPGFFEAAARLGLIIADPEAFTRRERDALFAAAARDS